VADALLDPPRTVRCARCAHDWIGVAVADDPVVEPTPEPVPEPAAEPVAALTAAPIATPAAEAPPSDPVVNETARPSTKWPPPEPEFVPGDTPLSAIERLSVSNDLSPRIRRRDRLLTAAWAASFALLAGLGVAGYTERDVLMQQWPASKRVYATLGLVPPDLKVDDGKAAAAKPAPEPAHH
jgi:hypothetical protein